MARALDHLIDGVLPSYVGVELTSRCNLRCQYCSVPHAPAYGAQDLHPDLVEKTLALLRNQPLQSVGLSGRGELTFVDGWEELVRRYRALSLPLHVTTNLARPLTWEQAQVLAGLDRLAFSLDSLDRDLLRSVRKGVDVRHIVANVGLIKAAAAALGKPRLDFELLSVVNVASVFGLAQVAAFAGAMGATRWDVADLVVDYSRDADVDVRHLSALPPARLRDAAAQLERAKALAESLGVEVSLWPPFADFLRGATVETVEIDSPHLGRYLRHATPVAPGETRDCLQPWFGEVLLTAAGGVEPCCGGVGSVGTYVGAASLREVANGEGMKRLRRELLTGELSELCRSCVQCAAVPIASLGRKVAELLGAKREPADAPARPAALAASPPEPPIVQRLHARLQELLAPAAGAAPSFAGLRVSSLAPSGAAVCVTLDGRGERLMVEVEPAAPGVLSEEPPSGFHRRVGNLGVRCRPETPLDTASRRRAMTALLSFLARGGRGPARYT